MRLCCIETWLLLFSNLSALYILRVQIPGSDDWFTRACGPSLVHRSIVLIECGFELPCTLG